jgi:glyoxylase-like metal-dependent hydrolase (beta-lactamase superfamily II)
MIRLQIPLLLVALLVPNPLPGQGFDDIRIETLHLSGNVYMLASRAGGNLAVCAGKDGVLLVDSEYAELTDKVRRAIAEISREPIAFIVNTHWHFDHTGGNADFAGGGSRIVAHERVRTRMATPQHIAIIEVDVPASPPEALPVITVRDSLTFHINDEEIVAFHPSPAHSDGDLIVHFRRANVLHMGDIVFEGGYPFIDVSAEGSIDGMIAAIETVLLQCDEDTKIVPGHGPLSDRTGLADYVAMLRRFRAVIAEEMAAGKDLASIQAATPTATLDEKWGRVHFSPEMFTEMVFRSLGGE